jgi:hypothetical protein
MNLGNLLIGIILTIICIIPFIILSQKGKSVKKNRLKALFLSANNVDCTINEHEFCGDYLIGIDDKKGVLFFNKQIDEKIEESHIMLSEIKNCTICTLYEDVKYDNESFREIGQLYLSFTSLIKNKTEQKLIFFDLDMDMMLSGELESIKKWLGIINKQFALRA